MKQDMQLPITEHSAKDPTERRKLKKVGEPIQWATQVLTEENRSLTISYPERNAP